MQRAHNSMGVISIDVDKKKASGFKIIGFEVVPCSVKFEYDL